MADSITAAAQELADAEPGLPERGPDVDAARREVGDARNALGSELDELGVAARGSLDIPTKLRRDPLRYGGFAAGAAFLALGGPKRILRRLESRFLPRPRVRRLTPKEIDRATNRLGEEDREAVEAHLEREFAKYLEREHAKEPPNARQSLWGTYDTIVAVLGVAAARELTKRLFERPPWRGQKDKPTPPPGEEAYTE